MASFAPAVIVHGAADVLLAVAAGRPVTLLSAPGAASYAGCAWWRALVTRARAAAPDLPVADILDCGDASGHALAALRIGQLHLVLWPDAAGWDAVAAMAAARGGIVLRQAPPALDLAGHGAARRLHEWLHPPPAPGDSNAPLR